MAKSCLVNVKDDDADDDDVEGAHPRGSGSECRQFFPGGLFVLVAVETKRT